MFTIFTCCSLNIHVSLLRANSSHTISFQQIPVPTNDRVWLFLWLFVVDQNRCTQFTFYFRIQYIASIYEVICLIRIQIILRHQPQTDTMYFVKFPVAIMIGMNILHDPSSTWLTLRWLFPGNNTISADAENASGQSIIRTHAWSSGRCHHNDALPTISPVFSWIEWGRISISTHQIDTKFCTLPDSTEGVTFCSQHRNRHLCLIELNIYTS